MEPQTFEGFQLNAWMLDLAEIIRYGSYEMLAQSAAHDTVTTMIDDSAGLLAVLLGVLAIIFWATKHPVIGKLFKVVPALVFCYFIPTTLTTLGVIPAEAPLYSWVRSYVLPASLLLLVIALDVKGILRLGPKAIIMLLSGTVGVVIGGPIALFCCAQWLPEDAWRGMAALSGSWIGGGANFVAIGDIAEVSSALMATMVIPDVLVANVWMGVLLYLAGHQRRIDKWTGADSSAIRDLEQRMADFQERTSRIPTLGDLITILAFGFVGSYLSYRIGLVLPELGSESTGTIISHTTWKYVLVTTIGIALSFTRVRNLEGAGASKIGSVMLYLLVACIGASADFGQLAEAKFFVLAGFIWIAVHVVILLTIAKLIRAPMFFVAVGSQANIGGAASAPVVAAAFHPALAPVGVLLAIAGYVLGTYAGVVCMHLMRMVAEAGSG